METPNLKPGQGVDVAVAVDEASGRGLVIELKSIVEVKVATWHGMSFSRNKIRRIVWRHGGEKLSSGFIVDGPEQLMRAYGVSRTGLLYERAAANSRADDSP